MFDFVKEHSGEIAVTLAFVTVAIPGVVVVAHVSAGVAIAATCVSGVSGCASLFSGGYYLGRRDEAAEEQERNFRRQEYFIEKQAEMQGKEVETELLSEHNNELKQEITPLNTKLYQYDLRITSLTNRQDAAETTRAKDRMTSERQHNEHERRLSEIEGLLANSVFTNNPGNNIRHRGAAANDKIEDGHRGRHRSRQGPGQI